MARTLQDKLAILSDAAKYDASCASSGSQSVRGIALFGPYPTVGAFWRCYSAFPKSVAQALLARKAP